MYLICAGYLDTKVTRDERIEVAKRIQLHWRRIGDILGPEPRFQSYDLDGFEQERDNRDRAQSMLDAWANKHHTKATRRHLIKAMKNEGYGAQIAAVFEGNRN